MMNKFMISATAALAIAAASAPVSAQYGSQSSVYAGGGMGITNRIAQLDARLQAGVSNGAIDRMEARSLRQQIRQLSLLERQYSRNGLTQQERRDLQQRIRLVRQELRSADDDQRYANWNDESYYANDDVYGGYDANRGPGYPGYGYQGSGYRDSRYRQVNEYCAANRTGISAILGAILGADNCLRVGERVTTNLAAVPTEYRDEFPTRSGYRYGYLEGNVVEIDSRTGVVSGIYDAR